MTHGVEVLLVEDSPLDAEMTMRALRRVGLANRIVAVADGEAALDFLFARGEWMARAAESLPCVVFLDLKLPKVDGLEVLRALKGDARLRSIPVVIMTSSAEERDRLESYSIGANSYVVKPIDFEAFAKTIAEVGFYWLAVNEPPEVCA